jgi:hypothetical protein
MKKLILGIISLIFIASSFSSCTVEKRVHQDGYHISWKHRHVSPSEIQSEQTVHTSVEPASSLPIDKPNVHSVETLSASSAVEQELVLTPKKPANISYAASTSSDTIVPSQSTQHEEYFSNNYTPPSQANNPNDAKLANWSLGLGIAALSAPVWITLLFFLVFALVGATMSTVSVWTALGLAVLLGGGIFITLEVLAITFAIRFLRAHGKDPNYTKYRKRAITALILAGIYPALMAINIILAIALAL